MEDCIGGQDPRWIVVLEEEDQEEEEEEEAGEGEED
jgi:hypothetical protein